MDLRRPRRSKLLVRCDGRYNSRLAMNPFVSIEEKVLRNERLSFEDDGRLSIRRAGGRVESIVPATLG